MDELIKTLPSLGIGGILAGLIFYWYRQDVQRYTEQWKGQSEALIKVVQDNTSSNITLAVLVKSLHDHMVNSDRLIDRRRDQKEQL